MGNEIWPVEHRPAAAKAIRRLLASRLPRGFPIGTGFDLDTTALLATARKGRQYRLHLLRALQRLSGNEEDVVAALEATMKQVVDEIAKQWALDTKKWVVFFGIETHCNKFSVERCRVRFLGTDFVLMSGSRFRRHWNAYVLKDRSEFFQGRPTSLVAVALAEGVDGKAAYRNVERAFETFRGCVELRLSYGVNRYSSSPTAAGGFPPADWMIAVRPGSAPQFVRLINPDTTQDKSKGLLDPLLPATVMEAVEPFDFLREDPPERLVDSVISACLRLYSQAMDQVFPYAQFLGLWQLAEAICGVKPGQTRGDPVPMRLGWFQTRLKGFEALACRECVQYLQNLRHDLVHKGTLYEIDQEDVNLLKYYCEVAISIWLALRKDLPTREHLDSFYDLLGQKPAAQGALADAAKVIQGLKPPN